MDRYFNLTDSILSSKTGLREYYMKDTFQIKLLRGTKSIGAAEKLDVLVINGLEPEVAPPKKTAKIDEISPRSRQGKRGEGTTKSMPHYRATMGSTIEELAGTGETAEMPVVEKVQTSTTKPRPVVYSQFDNQLGHKPVAGYSKPSVNVDMVMRPLVDDCRRISCFSLNMTGAKYNQVAPVLRASPVP